MRVLTGFECIVLSWFGMFATCGPTGCVSSQDLSVDFKLVWHVCYLRADWMRVLDILQVVFHPFWAGGSVSRASEQ
jgi:hypothetical protein